MQGTDHKKCGLSPVSVAIHRKIWSGGPVLRSYVVVISPHLWYNKPQKGKTEEGTMRRILLVDDERIERGGAGISGDHYSG